VLHTAWVLQEIQRMKQVSTIQNFMRGTKKEYENEKENARGHITSRVTYWNAHYGYTYGRIAIKNMTTRWGSCSQKGNLNFHYKAMYLPSDLLDYLVVHELCHLREMNHGPAFWALVAKTIPAYKEQRRRLRVIASHTLNMPGMKKYDA
jgi:predicted metal-dependent hydrolase